MSKNRSTVLLSIVMILAFLLTACGAQPAPAPTEAPVAETPTWPDWATAGCNAGDANVTINGKSVSCREILNGKAPNNVAADQPDGEALVAETPTCAKSLSEYMETVSELSGAELLDYYAQCGMFQSNMSVAMANQPVGRSLDYTTWNYFADFCRGLTDPSMHGVCIDKLNALYVGIRRDLDGNTRIKTGPNEVEVIMAGLYTVDDITFGGQVFPYLAEGKTGVFVALPNSDFVIPGANAHFTLTGWTGETSPREGTAALVAGHVKAQACAPVSNVVDALAYAGTPDLFEEMDKIVADNPKANIGYGYVSVIENAEAGKTFAWGSLERGVGTGWRLVSSADGMGLYVSDGNGKREVYGPNGAVQTCATLQNYTSYPAAEIGNKPNVQRACVKNAAATETFNKYWDDQESLFAMMSLWPMAIYPEPVNGQFDAKWNTLVIGRNFVDGMPETDTLMPFSMTDELGVGNNEFGGSAFIKTDGIVQIEGPYGVISFCDGAFSPADQIDGWGK